jgi:ADP-ribose pyrophosphatase YjhB (NUDIX family)
MEETGLRVRLSPFPLVNSVLFENQLSRVHSVRFIYRAAQTGGELRHEVSGSTDLAEWVPLQKVTARPRADIVNLTLEMLKP